jgi:hypothetical protein
MSLLVDFEVVWYVTSRCFGGALPKEEARGDASARDRSASLSPLQGQDLTIDLSEGLSVGKIDISETCRYA